jgi:hypothetical protein
MKLKTLSLYAYLINFLHIETAGLRKYVKIGDLLLSFKLINTDCLSAESKLTYAHLFLHRHNISGFKIRILCDKLGMTDKQIRNALKELEDKNHIELITTKQSVDLSELAYYYKVLSPELYGMLDMERKQLSNTVEITLSTTAK